MNESSQRNKREAGHLLWRAGFGPAPDQPDHGLTVSPRKLVHQLLKDSLKKPEPLNVADLSLNIVLMAAGNRADAGQMPPADPARDAEKRRQWRKQSAIDIRSLSVRWLDEMTESRAQLREKMSLFWHGHFASRTGNILYDQQLLQILRENALGDFRQLLRLAARSASLSQFLNNNQNRKNHPNENFARELMELFTLGRGQYTETDVKEAARAFTGWGFDAAGSFQFRERQHDPGPKTFLGRTGNWTGDDILNIILEQQQCAAFITGKIYRFFVNEQAPADRITALANRFFESSYDIADLLKNIFTSDWFYEEENMGNRVKSPVEWLVGMRRQIPVKWEDPQGQLLMLRLLGQTLFNPPNVAGWPGGRHWIDSSSLMLRLRFPALMDDGNVVKLKPKADDDTEMGMSPANNPGLERIRAKKAAGMGTTIDWETFEKSLPAEKDENLYEAIRSRILLVSPVLSMDQLRPFLETADRAGQVRTLTLRFIESPEYQLC